MKLNKYIANTLLVIISAAFSSCLSFQSQDADLIIHNAVIYTVDNRFSVAQAIAVKDGKILETGPERQIMNKYHAKETVDARKQFVYPGFIDAHCHFLGYGISLQWVDLRGCKTKQEMVQRVIGFAKTLKNDGSWILGRGWDQNEWPDKQFPDNRELDSLFPERPVFLKRVDGHAALANSEALRRAGVTDKTSVAGGDIVMRNAGLTGILVDNAVALVEDIIPQPDDEQKTSALLVAQQNCFATGLTTVSDAGLSKTEIELIDKLHKEGKLKMNVYAMLSDTKENFEHFLISGPYKTDRLNVRSFKFYADGALGSRGAALLQPYNDIHEKSHHGWLLHPSEYFIKYAERLYRLGFQMNTHCIGDSACRLMLDIYGEVLQTTNDRRWRIEHAQVVHPDDLPKFAEFSILPSVQPTHATSDMKWAGERLGPERVHTAYTYKQLLDQNGLIALGTDFPVEGISPLHTFYAAVARKDSIGFPENGFQSENALTKEEALRGMTIFAAIASFEENEKGSLEPGKYADMVILDTDLLNAPMEQVLKAKVQATYVHGEKVHSEFNLK